MPEVVRKNYCVIILIIANLIPFVAMTVSSGWNSLLMPDKDTLLYWQANLGAVTANGQYWRLVTSMFIHAGIFHVALNMYALWAIGPAVCSAFGAKKFLTIYMLSGVAGALTTMVWNPTQISVGASGALFGVCGALLTLLIRDRNKAATDNAWLSISPWVFAAFILGSLTYGFFNPAMDTGAHIGGFLAGFVLGFILRPKQVPSTRIKRMLLTAAITVYSVVAIFLGITEVRADKRVTFYQIADAALKDLNNKKFAEAVVAYNELLKLDPEGVYYIGRAAAFTGLKKYEEAIADCNRALALDPKDQAARFARAWTYHAIGKDRQAISELTEIISAAPRHSAAYNSRAWSLMAMGDYNKAIADADRAIELSPDSAVYFDTRGFAYYFLGRNEKALADFDEGLKIDPNEASCYYHRARVYARLGDKNKAVQDQAMSQKLEYKPEPWEEG